MVVDLQAKLQKAKEKVQLAREAAEVEKKASYQLGVEETEIRFAKELSEVCRDYYDMTWDKALTAAGVPADFALRLLGSIYYHPQIRESSQAGDQGQGAEGEKGKDKYNGKKPSAKAKDVAKVKEAEARIQEIDPKAKDAPNSQPSLKEDLLLKCSQ